MRSDDIIEFFYDNPRTFVREHYVRGNDGFKVLSWVSAELLSVPREQQPERLRTLSRFKPGQVTCHVNGTRPAPPGST
jgi:hypothetical protein